MAFEHENERIVAEQRMSGRSPWRRIRGTAIMLLLAGSLAACADREAAVEPEVAASPPVVVETSPSPEMEASPSPMMSASPQPAGNVTLDDITENPETYFGQTVTVEGGIDEVRSEQAFTIASSTLVDANEVLVVSATGQAFDAALEAEQPVRVTGELREFVLAEIERDFDLTLDPELEAEFEGQPVIVASSVEVIGDAAAAPDVTTTPDADTTVVAGTDGNVTLGDITAEPDTYIDQTVTVEGGVDEVRGERAFTIADNTFLDLNEVLVLGANQEALDTALEADAPVVVTGTVRRLVAAEIEQELGFDLDTEIEAEFEDKPVIIADSVEAGVANVTLDAITEDPSVYAGETVTVNGGIDEVKTERAFTIVDNTFLDLNEVLVVGAAEETIDAALLAGSPVWVNGTVRTFNLVEVEEELGYDLDDAVFGEFEGKPVIVADEVRVVEVVNPTLDDITENPALYFGRLVTVDGGIDEVRSERAFTMASSTLVDANEVLVLGANEETLDAALAAEQPVRVTGTVRPLVVAEIERDFGFDLDPELEAEFEGKPVIIATNVEVVQ